MKAFDIDFGFSKSFNALRSYDGSKNQKYFQRYINPENNALFFL